jgi:hypothetical protein
MTDLNNSNNNHNNKSNFEQGKELSDQMKNHLYNETIRPTITDLRKVQNKKENAVVAINVSGTVEQMVLDGQFFINPKYYHLILFDTLQYLSQEFSKNNFYCSTMVNKRNNKIILLVFIEP